MECALYYRISLIAALSICALSAQASIFPLGTRYHVCFTPGENCTQEIVDMIDGAQKTLLVQGYGFTDPAILKAVVNAKGRGVDVKVILDKSQYSKDGKYRSSTYLRNNDVPVWIDNKVAIAHNKVMIADGKTIELGSFNYTKSAQKRNAENMLFIDDEGLAKEYADNWWRREEVSFRLN